MTACAPSIVSHDSWLAALYKPASRGLSTVPTTKMSDCCDRMSCAPEITMKLRMALIHLSLSNSGVAATAEFEADKWMRAIRSFIVISGAQLILSQQSDILVVGTVLSPRDAGLYSAASQLSWLTMLGAQAVIFVVLPFVSDLHARGRRAELQRLV